MTFPLDQILEVAKMIGIGLVSTGAYDLAKRIIQATELRKDTSSKKIDFIQDERVIKKIRQLALSSYILLIWDQLEDEEDIKGGWGKTLDNYSIKLYPEIYPHKKIPPRHSITQTRWALQGLLSVDPEFIHSSFAETTRDYLRYYRAPNGSGAYRRCELIGGEMTRKWHTPDLRHTSGAILCLLMLNNNLPDQEITQSLIYLIDHKEGWLSDMEYTHYCPAIADISACLDVAKDTSLSEVLKDEITASINASSAVLVSHLGTGTFWKELGYPHAELARSLAILRNYDFGKFYPSLYWRLLEHYRELFRRNSNIMPHTSSGEGVSFGNAASLYLLVDDAIKKGYADDEGKGNWCTALRKDLLEFITESWSNIDAHEYDYTLAWSEILSTASRIIDFKFPFEKFEEFRTKLKETTQFAKHYPGDIHELKGDELDFIRETVIPVAIKRGLIPS